MSSPKFFLRLRVTDPNTPSIFNQNPFDLQIHEVNNQEENFLVFLYVFLLITLLVILLI